MQWNKCYFSICLIRWVPPAVLILEAVCCATKKAVISFGLQFICAAIKSISFTNFLLQVVYIWKIGLSVQQIYSDSTCCKGSLENYWIFPSHIYACHFWTMNKKSMMGTDTGRSSRWFGPLWLNMLVGSQESKLASKESSVAFKWPLLTVLICIKL